VNGINIVILSGNIGKDAELTTTKGGVSLCRFSLATSHGKKGEEKTDWHRITLWGKSAENLAQYLTKGKMVAVQGRIQYSKVDEKYYTDIVASEVTFLGGRKSEEDRREPAGGEPGDDIPF